MANKTALKVSFTLVDTTWKYFISKQIQFVFKLVDGNVRIPRAVKQTFLSAIKGNSLMLYNYYYYFFRSYIGFASFEY